jgi:hypothetical protein
MRFPPVFKPARWSPVALVWSFLLPFGRLSELSVFIMAILGTRASGARTEAMPMLSLRATRSNPECR